MDFAAIGAAVEFHLQHTQVEPQLDLPLAVVSLDDADSDLIWPIRPIFQNGFDIPGHARVPCNREATNAAETGAC